MYLKIEKEVNKSHKDYFIQKLTIFSTIYFYSINNIFFSYGRNYCNLTINYMYITTRKRNKMSD